MGGLGLDGHGDVVQHVLVALGDLALHVHGDVHDDLLATADLDEVQVLHGVLESVALDVLGEHQVLLAGLVHHGEQGVGVADGQGGLLGRQQQVDGVLAVAVDDGGDQAGAAGLAGGALAEVGAAGDLDLVRHDASSSGVRPRPRWGARVWPGRVRRVGSGAHLMRGRGLVDHGACAPSPGQPGQDSTGSGRLRPAPPEKGLRGAQGSSRGGAARQPIDSHSGSASVSRGITVRSRP